MSAYSARTAIKPGISCSARRISRRPKSASDKSATLNGTVSAVMQAPRCHPRLGSSAAGLVRPRSGATTRPYGRAASAGTSRAGFLTRTCKICRMRITEAARSARPDAPDAPLPGVARPAADATARGQATTWLGQVRGAGHCRMPTASSARRTWPPSRSACRSSAVTTSARWRWPSEYGYLPTRGCGPKLPSWGGASGGSSRSPHAHLTSSRSAPCGC